MISISISTKLKNNWYQFQNFLLLDASISKNVDKKLLYFYFMSYNLLVYLKLILQFGFELSNVDSLVPLNVNSFEIACKSISVNILLIWYPF